jgi:hypothetical protein
MREIPDNVREWLKFGGSDTPMFDLKTCSNSKIEEVSIITGIVGNTMSKNIREFVEENSTKNYLAVNDYNEEDNVWGSLAIPFDSRESAEEFRERVSEEGGHLRLSSGEYDGWFLFEAE